MPSLRPGQPLPAVLCTFNPLYVLYITPQVSQGHRPVPNVAARFLTRAKESHSAVRFTEKDKWYRPRRHG